MYTCSCRSNYQFLCMLCTSGSFCLDLKMIFVEIIQHSMISTYTYKYITTTYLAKRWKMQHLHIVKIIIIKKKYLKARHLRLNITSSTKQELFLGTLWYIHPSRGRITVFFQSAGFIGSSHLQLFLQLCSLASKTLQALPLLLTSITGLRWAKAMYRWWEQK